MSDAFEPAPAPVFPDGPSTDGSRLVSDTVRRQLAEGPHVKGHERRFVPYNGGLGEEQLAWMRMELADAAKAGERVLIMCHVILHPEACGGSTMVWDYPEALDVIRSPEARGCVAAVLCGHDHFGQYHCDEDGVHHCTFCSPLNKGDDGFAFGLMCARRRAPTLHTCRASLPHPAVCASLDPSCDTLA